MKNRPCRLELSRDTQGIVYLLIQVSQSLGNPYRVFHPPFFEVSGGLYIITFILYRSQIGCYEIFGCGCYRDATENSFERRETSEIRVVCMRARTAVVIVILFLAICILPVAAETIFIQTTPDNVLITISSAAGTIASGRSAPDSVHGGSWFQADIPPGSYTIRGERDGYVTQTTTTIVISGWSPTVTLDLPTASVSMGRIVAATNVCGAEIGYSDPTKTTIGFGTTLALIPDTVPCYYSTSVPAGTYEISARKPGYETQHQTVTVTAGSETPVSFTLSGPAVVTTTAPVGRPGEYTLEISPGPASVKECISYATDEGILTQGKTICTESEYTAPRTSTLLSSQYLELTASKKGYIPQMVKVQISPGEIRAVRITLQPAGAELFPTATPQRILPYDTPTREPMMTLTVVPTRTVLNPDVTSSSGEPTAPTASVTTAPAPEATGPVVTLAPPDYDVIGGLLRFFGNIFGGR